MKLMKSEKTAKLEASAEAAMRNQASSRTPTYRATPLIRWAIDIAIVMVGR